MIHFITSNKNKFEEAQVFIPDLKQLDIDLLEIQSLDHKEIIRYKLEQAYQHTSGEFIVEDTSLHLDALGGLPGPFIKWFMESIGNTGLARIALELNKPDAVARTVIGYSRAEDDVHFFEGMVKGTIVKPQGKSKFGWDPIFMPNGQKQTFAEMDQSKKNEISSRSAALRKLKEWFAAS
ncbi:non-canonical purine NTP pyrophosphatase [Candidatus Parcubacteria bacterium]|nr:non-canonical purine NTP pyrophosphatase [Candidatus Parcubacteria bacterium]